jgi:hypothetical protein
VILANDSSLDHLELKVTSSVVIDLSPRFGEQSGDRPQREQQRTLKQPPRLTGLLRALSETLVFGCQEDWFSVSNRI